MQSIKHQCEERAFSYGLSRTEMTPMSGYPLTQKAKDSAFRKTRQQKALQHRMFQLNRTLAREASVGPDFVSAPATLANKAKEMTLQKLIGRMHRSNSSEHKDWPAHMTASTLGHARHRDHLELPDEPTHSASNPSVPLSQSTHGGFASMSHPVSLSHSLTASKRPFHQRSTAASVVWEDPYMDIRHRVSVLEGQARQQKDSQLCSAISLCEEAEAAIREWRRAIEVCHQLYDRWDHSHVFTSMLGSAIEVDQRLCAIKGTVQWLSEESIEERAASGLMSHRHLQLMTGDLSESSVAHEAIDAQMGLRQEVLTESYGLFMLHWHMLQQQLSDTACLMLRRSQGSEIGEIEPAERKLERLQSTMESLALTGSEVAHRLEVSGGSVWDRASTELSREEVRLALRSQEYEINEFVDSRVRRTEARQIAATVAQRRLDAKLAFV